MPAAVPETPDVGKVSDVVVTLSGIISIWKRRAEDLAVSCAADEVTIRRRDDEIARLQRQLKEMQARNEAQQARLDALSLLNTEQAARIARLSVKKGGG